MARMDVAVTHRMGNAVDALPEVFGATSQHTAHLIDFSPVPFAPLVFAKLPHLAIRLSSRDAVTMRPRQSLLGDRRLQFRRPRLGDLGRAVFVQDARGFGRSIAAIQHDVPGCDAVDAMS